MTRQQILSLESFLVTQLLASTGNSPETVRHLRLMGKFYADKFMMGQRTVPADFERALYYFQLELEKSGRDIWGLNDLAWLHMVVARPPRKELAEQFLRESLRLNADQQRANYDLGTLIFDATDPHKLAAARKYLEAGVKATNWETSPNEEFASSVHYNLACTYSRLASFEQDTRQVMSLLNSALEQLEKAAERGGTEEKTLQDDLATEDLKLLGASPDHQVRISAILDKFRRAWSERARRQEGLSS